MADTRGLLPRSTAGCMDPGMEPGMERPTSGTGDAEGGPDSIVALPGAVHLILVRASI